MPRVSHALLVLLALSLVAVAGAVHATTGIYQVSGVGGLAFIQSSSQSFSGTPTSVTFYLPYNIWASSQFPISIGIGVYNSNTASVTTTVSANCSNVPLIVQPSEESITISAQSSTSISINIYPPSPGYLTNGFGYAVCTVTTNASGTYFTGTGIAFWVVENLTAVDFDNATAFITINMPNPVLYYSVSGTNHVFNYFAVFPWWLIGGYRYPWQIVKAYASPPYGIGTIYSPSIFYYTYIQVNNYFNFAPGETTQPVVFTVTETGGFGAIAGKYSVYGSDVFESTPAYGVIGSAVGYVTLAVTNASSSTMWDTTPIWQVSGVGNLTGDIYVYASGNASVVQLATVPPGSYYGLFLIKPPGGPYVLPLPVIVNVTIDPMPISNRTLFLGNTTDVRGFYVTASRVPGHASELQLNYAINVPKFLGYPSLVPWLNFSEVVSVDIFNATHVGQVITIPNPHPLLNPYAVAGTPNPLPYTYSYQSVLAVLPPKPVVTVAGGEQFTSQVLVIPDISIVPNNATIQPTLYLVNNQPYTCSPGSNYVFGGPYYGNTDVVFMGIAGLNGTPTMFFMESGYSPYPSLVIRIGGNTTAMAPALLPPTNLFKLYCMGLVYEGYSTVTTPTGVTLYGYVDQTSMGSGFELATWTTTYSSGSAYYGEWFPGLAVLVALNDTPFGNEVFAIGQSVVGVSGTTRGSEVTAYVDQPIYVTTVQSPGTWFLNQYLLWLFTGVPLYVRASFTNGQPASGYLVNVTVPNIIGLSTASGAYNVTEVYQPIYGGALGTLSASTNASGVATIVIPAVWALYQFPNYTVQVDGVVLNQVLNQSADSLGGVGISVTLETTSKPSQTTPPSTPSPAPTGLLLLTAMLFLATAMVVLALRKKRTVEIRI